MPVIWTKEQQRVIDERGKDMLVSAAAGSGKTAVLVARILKRITDEKDPVDIDRLLVVTFTNAAADEMRGRIRDALEELAFSEPENVRLQRQLVLVHNAKIMTIHSFCLHVLRNHFQTIGLDPSFRVADTGEVLLLEQDTVQEIVNEAYESGDTLDFTDFLEQFATGKGDAEIGEMILQLYHFAQGQPFPRDWLRQCREMYENPGTEEGREREERPDWVAFMEEDTAMRLADIRGELLEALRITREPDGPYPYEKALRADLEMLDRLEKGSSYLTYSEAFRSMESFVRLGSKKDPEISEEKREQVKAMRDDCKDQITALRDQYYYDDPAVLSEEFAACGAAVRELTRLTELFMDRLAEKKTEKNVLDFNDMEHFALQALVQKDPDDPQKLIPTAVAGEYAETFEEVMTDEYQDSNLVQELILSSVSGKGCGIHNRFMVGDVKQSIYRFRLARPELFMEKFRQYREMEADGEQAAACRIDLDRNFRSRRQVLDCVNGIFAQIMTEPLGGITYDADAALYPGASFPEAAGEDGRDWYQTELLLADMAQKSETDPDSSSVSMREEEAQMTGRRIRELVGVMPVRDQKSGELRPARYGDMVILLRTVRGWAETFSEVLTKMGIPCFTGSQTGYFSAAEIRVVLSYLQILDNPLQDIPLAAVLRSAVGKFTDEELAQIRLLGEAAGAHSFYDCCRFVSLQSCGSEAEESISRKLRDFFAVYEMLREKSAYTPVHQLLWELLDATGYGDYAAALPAGRQRKANLDMLVEKAIAYESTSYRGLYHFVRYIESLQEYEVDYGEANLGSEADDTVRIMSIHKSKGLEFPIVFVCGLGKKFNETDIHSRIVLHPEWGIACDYIRDSGEDLPRMRQPTLLKKSIQQKLVSENLGEELRILYVAMTRAEEKLILTGGVSDFEKKKVSWDAAASAAEGGTLPYSRIASASTYLDWVVPAFSAAAPGNSIFISAPAGKQMNAAKQQTDDLSGLRKLQSLDPEVCLSEQARTYLEEAFASAYPFAANLRIPGKLTVSELKKQSQSLEENDAQELYPGQAVVPLIPKFQKKTEKRAGISGAERGTIYHAFMENLNFSGEEELRLQLEELVSCGKMSQEDAAAIRLEEISGFLDSPIGRRMKRAALEGTLFREQPFVLGVAAQEIFGGEMPAGSDASEETILVQGIIDAYFTEDGQITVVDYKTDQVPDENILAERYRIQMEYYAKALHSLTGMPIADAVIYSFHLGREIHLLL